jgi:hypothetical protein
MTRAKRITLNISDNIDAIKRQLEEQLGINMSYAQVIDYLIKFYRQAGKPNTTWRT